MAQNTTIGGSGADGELRVLDATGQRLLDVAVGTHPSRKDAEVKIGGEGRNGLLRVGRAKDKLTTTISDGGLSLVGSLSMYNADQRNPLNINPFGDEIQVLLGDAGVSAHVQLSSGNNGPGPIIELDGKANAFRMGDPGSRNTAKIEIVGREGRISAGGETVNGRVVVCGGDGRARATVNAADASVRVGGNGSDGTVSVMGADGQPLLELLGRANEAVLGLGQKNRPARISLYNGKQSESIKLDASTGDILLANADAAELFDVEGPAEPGTVMIISDNGTLVEADQPYDTRTAGIVSGAGDFRPGLVLDQRTTAYERAPIALVGKVFCRADAGALPIRPGDLLTTSATKGHVMRVADPARAIGAVVGKALAGLDQGTGLIPVLVTLQ